MKRDVIHSTATVAYNNTCYPLFRKRSCITVDRDNSTTPDINVGLMQRSIMRLEYNHCSENDVHRINEASRLRNAWMMVGPLEPHFGGQGAKMSNKLRKSR